MYIPKHRIDQYEEENPLKLTTEQFLKLRKEIENTDSNVISDEVIDFVFWAEGLPFRQEIFAKYVCKFLPMNASILEVGCGRTGKLSRILKDKGYNISCMDPKIDFAYLKNINSFKELFNLETDITKYDYLIAQEPCDATEYIVRACVAERKKMIMSLCASPHILINGTMPSSYEEWYSYLQNISLDNLRLRYANLDPFISTPILKTNF